MIAVLQRVTEAAVTADGTPAGACGEGLLVLLGVAVGDTAEDARLLADKIAALRIFCDEKGKMNRSVVDIGGGALVVSNFTLLANYRHGNRPDYLSAAAPGEAKALYETFTALLRERVGRVQTGVFGADMRICMTADGPVTIAMDSQTLRKKA